MQEDGISEPDRAGLPSLLEVCLLIWSVFIRRLLFLKGRRSALACFDLISAIAYDSAALRKPEAL